MKNTLLDFSTTRKFDPIFIDYIQKKPSLAPFYGLSPEIENFEQQIIHRQQNGFSAAKRQVLHRALVHQYGLLSRKPTLALDLLLNDNTFTITTGHQLNIFTGPLYFHYKIITVINAARQLRQRFPQYNFVPVYWMASEDHDAAEISYFHLFGRKYTWQPQQTGAVGRFAPQSLVDVIRQTPEMDGLFRHAYTEHATLADATRCIVNELYGHDGLVVVDGDDHELKSLFKEVIRDELLHEPSCKVIEQDSAKLAEMGYKIQVHPREINLFYLDNGLRERIVHEQKDGRYHILNTDISFSEEEMLREVEQSPEKFSPNVVLRPVYQEIILPNISYTGGPGELAYWLQIKGVFEHFHVPFPILLPRNHALYMTVANRERMDKLGLSIEDLFAEETVMKEKFIAARLTNPVELDAEIAAFEKWYAEIEGKMSSVDASLVPYMAARKQELRKNLVKIERKLKRVQEQRYATELNQLQHLLEKFFPKGGLQERTDNFLNFYLNDRQFLEKTAQHFSPFILKFNVLEEKK